MAAVLSCASGCFGVTQNPSYFPYLLPTGDVIRTHAKPIGPGYYANFDPHAVDLIVEPAGMTNNPQIPIAKSITDYIFRWLALKFLPDVADEVNSAHRTEGAVGSPAPVPVEPARGKKASLASEIVSREQQVFRAQADAPACSDCGEIMVRNGACYKCLNCGITSGCS